VSDEHLFLDTVWGKMGKKTEKSQISVKAWESEGLVLEKYIYTSGSVEPLPKHTHNEYQFGLSFDCQGEYYYRRTLHQIPTGSLSIIHSGEVHSPSQRRYLPSPATFWMMHVDPNLLQTAASEMAEREIGLPFFPVSFQGDRFLVKLFLDLHISIEKQASQLQRDWLFRT
jgi:AraC-like ligand binding domain